MDWVFLTSLEKKADGAETRTARVAVGERQGEWQVVWSERESDGRMQEAVWFQGRKWDEMMVAFRDGIQGKMREGYAALLDMAELRGRSSGWPGVKTGPLQFYAETHAVPELYDKLRAWRRSQAGKDGMAPYIIASNRLLQMISAYVPHTMGELRQIPGFGESRAGRYGEAVLSLTAEYERTAGFPLDWVTGQVDGGELTAWSAEQRKLKDETRQQQHAKRVGLLGGIAAGERLAELSERLAVPRRDLVRDIEQLDKEGYDVDPILAAELSDVAPEELAKAEGLLREIGDRLLKPVVEKLFGKEELQQAGTERVYEWLRLLRIRVRRERSAAAEAAERPIAG